MATKVFYLSLLFSLCVFIDEGRSYEAVECPTNHVFSTEGYTVDLSGLKGVWQTVYIKGTDLQSNIAVPLFYNISVIGPLETTQCNGHHICYTETFDAFHILGKNGSCKYHSENRVISLIYSYGVNSVYGSGNVTITLACGSTLGVPEVLEGDPRNQIIEILWITSAVCKTDVNNKTPLETKCYSLKHTIDEETGIQAEFVDLNGLIRNVGYEATMAERPDIIMNVSICRPMNNNDGCDGSNVCLYHGDSHLNVASDVWPLPLGYISSESHHESEPHYDSGTLTMIFPIKNNHVSCENGSPFAKVRFFCPSGDEPLGPYVEYIDDSLCVIIIVWYTMHACDIKTIQSTGLTLTTSQGIVFDLRGLPEVIITDQEDSKTYYYTIHPNINGNLNSGCQDDSNNPIHVTQTENSTAVCRSLGVGPGKLRYVDNVLTLTYTNGDTCSNGFTRTSIITFVCPKDVVGGAKYCDSTNASNCVSFNFEVHCVYEFEWLTDLACSSEDTSTSSCHFNLNNVDYNLGLLTEDYTSTYAAISKGESDTECYLINPCGSVEVTALTNLTAAQYCNQRIAPQSSCDQSSVCRIPISNSSSVVGENLGSFKLQQSSLMHSVVKDVISIATHPVQSGLQAIIHYVCQTGTLLTSPVFISRDANVIVEFHWYTFAACPQGVSIGSDCLVSQPSTGFTFNLSSLSNTIFNYTDVIHKYDYSVKVCSKLQENLFSGSCSSNSAICQHSDSNSHHKSAGQMNTTLIYANSAIKLHYNNGTTCSDNDARHTTVVFLCNPNVHFANVQNITEIEHCSYVVEMETKLACPPAYRSSECVYFAANGVSYDLSQLEKTTGNWEAEGSDGSVYLINVCRPLDLLGVGKCNPLSAVCKLSQSSLIDDLGLASTASFGPPPISADSHVTLVLNYTYPSSSDQGCSIVYTSIQFICNHTAQPNAGPRHLNGGTTANPCEYVFLWETRAVCPIEVETAKGCNITDEATGYTFDLAPLKKHHNNLYTATDDSNHNYTFTLCDVLTESKCTGNDIAVCQSVNSNHYVNSGKYSSMELTYVDKNLFLFYKGGDSCSGNDSRSTEIDFICDRFAGDDYFGEPKFVSESSHCHYKFEWATPLACPPDELSCLALGGKYDLQPLMEKRNWFVSSDDKGYQYVIGGCQSIDATDIPQCAPSVKVGACLYAPDKTTSGDVLGYLTGDLVEVSEGHLRLSYHNGKMCPELGLRSTVNVHFHCKPGIGAGSPVLDSSGCVTEITWDTQYACVQDNTTKGWIISNPSTGQTFDLTKLNPIMSSEHASFHSSYNYTVGLVGHTVPCGDQENVIICQTSISSGHTYVIARKDGEMTLQLVGGKVQFTLQNGDKCRHHDQINRKSTVYFEYDPRDDYLMVLPEQGCEYSFVVFTKLVKQEEQEIGTQCYVESFPDLEWFTSYPIPPIMVQGGTGIVYFSVCTPISSSNQEANSGYDTCSTESGACYVSGSKVINLGRPTVYYPPVVSPDGNAVQITYVNGDTCDQNPYKTTIFLVCSNTTGTLPEVNFNPSTCDDIVIIWRSPHACPLLIPITPISDSVCSITDPSDGTVLNLQALTDDGNHVTSTDGNYIIGMCGPVHKGADDCNNNHAGVCHKNIDGQWMKMTDANHTLTLVSHQPHAIDLQYSTGESCNGHMTWKINIHIYCSNKNNSKQPFFQSSEDCEMRFIWPTSALCLTEVEGCYVSLSDKTILDLESLVTQSWKGTYTSQGLRLGEFNVSVCRNLNPTISEGSHCYPGPAGICFQPDVTQNVYKNLGYMSTPPSITADNEIILHYTKGDQCGNGNLSTTVYMKCPDTEYDTPPQIRTTSTDCNYEIDWSTVSVCKHNKQENKSCIIDDTHSSLQYNFVSLAKQLTFTDDSYNYSVCLCPYHESCTTGSIYNVTGNNKKVNLGTFNELVVYPNGGPRFEYAGGDNCTGNNKYSSTVLMFCDRGVTQESGKFFYEEGLSIECHKFFSWWTPVACASSQISCIIQDPFYDFTPIYPPNGYWVATDSKSNEEYLINICGPLHVEDGIGCSGNTAICHKRQDGSYHDLAFASTQTMTINSNHNPEIHFSSFEKCSNNGKYSSVIIEMLCGLKGLSFKSNKNCEYRFDWYTTYACQESNSLHTQSNCNSYTDSTKLYTYLPNELTSDGGYHVPSIAHGMYHINLCSDEMNDCGSGISVCHTHDDDTTKYELGTSSSLSITIDSYWMTFTMTGKDGTSIITVECAQTDQDNPPSDIEKMTLENEFTTTDNKKTVYFRMYTAKGCNFDESKVPSSTEPPPTKTQSKSNNRLTTAFIIIVLVILLITVMIITIVLWKKERRDYVFKKLSSFLSVKADEPVRYVRAKTTDDNEASLLEESSSEEEQLAVNTKIINNSSNNTDTIKKQEKSKNKKKEKTLLAEYKDEEDHLSDEDLLNI